MKKTLVPSLPATSFEEIKTLLDALRGVAAGVQIDIVDGIFAPNLSWPFSDKNGIHALAQLSHYTDFEIEMDCMCMNTERYLDVFVQIGARRVIIHAGSTENYEACISHAREHGYRIGLGIMNDTHHDLYTALLPRFDFVQVMGIAHIGVQGQPFDIQTITTVSTLRDQFPELEIAVDGGVNEHTILDLLHAGANRFAPGSAITKAHDQCASYKHLLSLIDA